MKYKTRPPQNFFLGGEHGVMPGKQLCALCPSMPPFSQPRLPLAQGQLSTGWDLPSCVRVPSAEALAQQHPLGSQTDAGQGGVASVPWLMLPAPCHVCPRARHMMFLETESSSLR